MNSRKLGIGLVLVALAAAPLVAAPRAVAGGTTVGEFATELVTALGRDAHDMAAVRSALKSLGAPADFEAAAPLTTGTASRIASGLGVEVAPVIDADARVSRSRAAAIVTSIATVHMERLGIAADEEPTQCLSSVNRGACVNCCKEASGLGGQFCGHFCHANVPPPPSPEEPQP